MDGPHGGPPAGAERRNSVARNKYPEETVRKILDTARKLFLEKGYEKTSMQDIVNNLGMSKGAIYHHFKSKEELFEKVVFDFYSQEDWFHAIAADTSKNGLEQLRAMFRHEMSDGEKLVVDELYFRQVTDPRVFMEHMRLNLMESAPEIAKIIEKGNRDGSLSVKEPLETAELLLIMANVWIGLFADSREKFQRQITLCRSVLEGLGLPLLTEELMDEMLAYFEHTLCWNTSKLAGKQPEAEANGNGA